MIRLLMIPYVLACAFAQTPNLLERADEAFRQGDFDRAAAMAGQVLASNPGVAHAHMIAGIVAAQKNQWTVSDQHFNAVVRLEPTNPYGYFYLGQARLYQKQWQLAIQLFLKAQQREYPDRDRLMVELAFAQNEAGRPKDALDSLSKVTPPAGDDRLGAQYHAVTAFARANLNEPVRAIEAIRKALELDDSLPHSWEFLIAELIKMDQAPPALAAAIRAQRKFPDQPDILYLFALASFHVTESPLGHVAWRNLKDADPADPRVLLAEGLLHRKQGRTDEATKAFQQAAQRGAADARLLLAIVYRENGDTEAALRELRIHERSNPRSGQTALELGRLLLAKGQLEEARPRLEKAALALPENPTAHYQLGLLYRKLNQTEKAEQELQKSRELAGQAR